MRHCGQDSDVMSETALIPKGRVLGEKVANNFFSDCISDQKILMAFFTKTFRLIVRPEFNFRSPRSLEKRPLRFPIFSGK